MAKKSKIFHTKKDRIFNAQSVEDGALFRPIGGAQNAQGEFSLSIDGTISTSIWCDSQLYYAGYVNSLYIQSILCIPQDISSQTAVKYLSLTDDMPVINTVGFVTLSQVTRESIKIIQQYKLPMLLADYNGDGYNDQLLQLLQPTFFQIFFWNITSQTFSNVATTINVPIAWCPTAYMISGDFDADGLSDLMCSSSDTYKILYASNNNDGSLNFISKSGYGNGYIMGLSNLNWCSGFVVLRVGDFDGDGYSDIFCKNLIITNTPTPTLTNVVKVLFTTKDNSFVSRNNIDNLGTLSNINWPSSNADIFVIGDFDGNGKSDIYVGDQNQYLLYSQTQPLNAIENLIGTVQITDIDIAPINTNLENAETSVYKVTCNSTIISDQNLNCEVSNKNSVTSIQGLDTQAKWLSPNNGVNVTIQLPTKLSFAVNQNNVQYSTSEGETNSYEATTTISVGSLNCVHLTMITRHLHDVSTTFTASANFYAVSGTENLSNVDLISLAKKVIANPTSIDLIDSSTATFQISGEIKVSIMLESYSEAENCY